MKKLFLGLLIVLFVLDSPLQAAEKEGFITRLGKFIDGKKSSECPVCPTIENGVVCPNTPYDEIKRPPFEVEARLDGFATPAQGSAQFHVDNFSFTFKHNFSPVLNLYSSYSIANIEKTNYENSLYDKTWHYQTLMAGLGWYVHPIIEIFAGVGKVIANNSEGAEELGMAIEYGIKAHWAMNPLGYKFIAGLVTREVPLADENVEIQRSSAEASATYIFAGVALPFGGWK